VICGPSGVGKGTLIDKLVEDFPERFGFSVSHTTRKPRPGEKDGVHYTFVEKAAMEKEIAEGKFLEHARVHDNIYGTSFAAVDAVSNAGRVCVLDIDVQGAELVKKSALDAVFVFIAPPSMAELERRLRGRGTEKEESIKTRLANAGKEMEKTKEDGFFDRVIVNDTIHTSYCSLKAVVAGEARRAVSSRALPRAEGTLPLNPKPLTDPLLSVRFSPPRRFTGALGSGTATPRRPRRIRSGSTRTACCFG
jgi:guanylate kinase